MPDESAYPKIAPDLHYRVRFASTTAIAWCVATSFYVFLYGICGSVKEKAPGAGYECTMDGQESGTTRNWVASFIVFTLVSLVSG